MCPHCAELAAARLQVETRDDEIRTLRAERDLARADALEQRAQALRAGVTRDLVEEELRRCRRRAEEAKREAELWRGRAALHVAGRVAQA